MYYKDLLKQLSDETGLSEEVIERERVAKPNLIKDFLRGLERTAIPDSLEIRNKITLMIRTVAFQGYSIIVGQGGYAATADIKNGLSVRIEAPADWRISRICIREKLNKKSAAAKMEEIEQQRKYLHTLYAGKNPRQPAFSLVFDNSIFKKEQIADLILQAMEVKGMISPIEPLRKAVHS